ncbi:TetR/AcrR family transcriptional regulator [Kitasatospora kifunensis]|uniref:AcrR family transcriptional regulator n=1 Tax=Kitasatospora kifunensis TaxID=58351 RepID=A0A7W7R8K1_KITKI|nr:TetR/AcrR family transcriptional regulator [Kitasatospora kifunensis]MBB4927351.1 AcrR family transcriptional regulator [Kitasatospora kifunensis]
MTTNDSGPPRERILAAAMRLFYAQGVRGVGIDQLIRESAVANATFYRHFPSKDEVVLAYVREHDRVFREAAAAAAAGRSPHDAVAALFAGIADQFCEPGFRGCPFINTAADYPDPGHPVSQAIQEHMDWFHDQLAELLTAAGHPDAESGADTLLILRHGAMNHSRFATPRAARAALCGAVTTVLDQAGAGARAPGNPAARQARCGLLTTDKTS